MSQDVTQDILSPAVEYVMVTIKYTLFHRLPPLWLWFTTISTYMFHLELTGVRCFLRTSFLDFFDISEQFIPVRFPFNEDVARILDEQADGSVNGSVNGDVNGGVNKVLLSTTVYMYVVSVYVVEGESIPLRA